MILRSLWSSGFSLFPTVENLLNLCCSSALPGGGTNSEFALHSLFEAKGDVMVRNQEKQAVHLRILTRVFPCFCVGPHTTQPRRAMTTHQHVSMFLISVSCSGLKILKKMSLNGLLFAHRFPSHCCRHICPRKIEFLFSFLVFYIRKPSLQQWRRKAFLTRA